MFKMLMLLIGTALALQALAAEPVAPAKEAPKAADQQNAPKADAVSAARQTSARNDRLDLDTTTVTGNRELPKVLYIVPWKKSDIGNLPGQPFNTLLDEVLTPVDRDVFRREVTYYQAVSGPANTSAAPTAAPAGRPEK